MAIEVNCWEYLKCGREPGGAKEKERGSCPASTITLANGINRGAKGGRICWEVIGTMCGGRVQGSFAMKQTSCVACAFYWKVKEEEGTVRFELL
jgi:hypothetical protein